MVDVLKAVAPEARLPDAPASAFRPRNRHDHGHGQEGWFNLSKVINLKFRDPDSGAVDGGKGVGVPIRGLSNDVPVTFEEGGAVPGDRIVGVLVPGEGIRVFQIHSPRLKDHEQDSWIDVAWHVDPERPERFPARLSVTARNEPGALAQIAQVIGEGDGNIDNLRMQSRAGDFTVMLIEVEVWDLAHLNQIIAGLRGKPMVGKVERVFG